jgi:uncharacterized protein involved in outer membrane biogenesis
MKKLLLYGGIAVVVLALGVYITMQFFLGSIVKAGVNKFGPAITQTKVQLEGAHISPLSGQGTLSDFTVGNPTGWSAANAFHLGTVHIDVEPASIFGDHIVINEVTIEKPEFTYETKIVASNISDLLNNIEQATGGNRSAQPTAKNGKPIKIVIKHLVLRNGRVTLSVPGTAPINIPMPPIDMTDIGTAENGITPAQVAVAVMRNVTTNVVAASTQALGTMGGTSGAAAAEGAKQIGNAIKGLFGGKK